MLFPVLAGLLPVLLQARCFVDPVWNASELYHDFNHAYGATFDPASNRTQELLMDFYAPPTEGPRRDARSARPTVLLVHGGSFVGGDKSSWAPLATALAQRGFVAASINYRLTGAVYGAATYCCPGNASDQYALDAVHDARAAVRYLRKVALGAAWRLDTGRIGLGGGSAGAVAAAFYGYARRAQGEGSSGNPGFASDVRFVMPVSGELAYDAFCRGGLDPASGAPRGCTLGSWNYTTEIDGANATAAQPPLLLVHGTADTTVPFREAQQMHARAEATGLRSQLVAIPGAGHVPQAQLVNASLPWLGQALEFIAEVMDLDHAECPAAPS